MSPRSKIVKKKLKQLYKKTLRPGLLLQNCNKTINESIDDVNCQNNCLLDVLVLPSENNDQEFSNISNVLEEKASHIEGTAEEQNSKCSIDLKNNYFTDKKPDPVVTVLSHLPPFSSSDYKSTVCTQTSRESIHSSKFKSDFPSSVAINQSTDAIHPFSWEENGTAIRKHDIVISKSHSHSLGLQRTSSNWSTGRPTGEMFTSYSLDEKRERIKKYANIYKSLQKSNRIHAVRQIEKTPEEKKHLECTESSHENEPSIKRHRRPRTKRIDYSLYDTYVTSEMEAILDESNIENDIKSDLILCDWNNLNVNKMDNSEMQDKESIVFNDLTFMSSHKPNKNLKIRAPKPQFINSDNKAGFMKMKRNHELNHAVNKKQILHQNSQGDNRKVSWRSSISSQYVDDGRHSSANTHLSDASELEEDNVSEIQEKDAIGFITTSVTMVLLSSIMILLFNGFTIGNIIFSAICLLSLLTILFAFPSSQPSTVKTT